ncbi:phospholipase [Microbacterium sp. gxy059]|uniref:aggregation-promoting factor C-terminal-like domain-containing protein n=1 Tax=Microbacterium sp. gxy059 TaxID=2957199 RepID=UPI003D99EDBA
MTPDETRLALPSFPRPNHVRLLRQERERRRRRIAVIAASAAGVVAIGAGTTAFTLAPDAGSRAVAAEALVSAETSPDVDEALTTAHKVMERAEGKVDTTRLEGFVTSLEDDEGIPAPAAVKLSSAAVTEAEELADQVSAAEEEERRAAEERKRQEEQRKAEVAAAEAEEAAAQLAEANTVEGAQATAQKMMADEYGWGSDQFGCLDQLWTKESGWDYQATNASSGAYGIPQSLPGSKMAGHGDDWQSNAATQISWGLEYISSVYGTPCAAWGHSQATDWY